MSIPIASGFKLGTAVPLDDRTEVQTYAELVALPTADIYDGMIIYVKDDQQHYAYTYAYLFQ